MWTICVCAASQNKEWKPKSSQKPSLNGLGVIGTPTKSASPSVHNSKDLDAFKVKKKTCTRAWSFDTSRWSMLL